MAIQAIQFDFDTDAVWERIRSRRSVFLDTNCWINMADETGETACRVRDRLAALVAGGKLFCPLSWGIIEELLLQTGESLERTAALMEELSVNACFPMRSEAFQWEFARSLGRHLGLPESGSLKTLFVPPVAYSGSRPQVTFNFADGVTLGPEQEANAKAAFRAELGSIGVRELARRFEGPLANDSPPAYSEAAKKAIAQFKGNKSKLFVAEAGNCFYMYITPLLSKFPIAATRSWLAQFGEPGDEVGWFQRALAELPALHNYVDLMVVADSLPDRKDSNNHFMDNEIVVLPLAYADAFVTKDRGIRDTLRNRTTILDRTTCQYCDGLEALDDWLTANLTGVSALDPARE